MEHMGPERQHTMALKMTPDTLFLIGIFFIEELYTVLS